MGLKDWFVEPEDDFKTSKQPKSVATVAAPPRAVNVTLPATNTMTPIVTPVSGKMKDALSAQFTGAFTNTPYATYMKMNTGMKTKIADTSQRVSAIAASMEISNITKAMILDDAARAVQFLNNEAAEFAADVSNNLSTVETNLKGSVNNIEMTIELKQGQIKALQEEILNLQKQKSETETQANADKTSFELSRVEFNSAFNSMLQEVNNDISDINRYIGG